MKNEKYNNDLDLLYGIKPAGDKITVKKKLFSEIINLLLIIVVYSLLFTFIGKSIIVPKYAKDSIDQINNIYQNIANDHNYETKIIENNYGFIEIDEEKFIENFLIEHSDKSKEESFEAYIETRAEMFVKVRADVNFKTYNGKFNSVYYLVYIILIFIPLFVLEFIVPAFSKKRQTIGMKLTKTSLVNVNNNDYLNKLKFLPRFIVILIIEHILLKYLFGDFYFIITLLINVITIYVTPSKLVLHDILSMTKVIKEDFVGYKES